MSSVIGSALLLLCVLIAPTIVLAQTDESLRIDVARASPGGVNVYSPEKWGLLHVNVTNTSEKPRHLLVSTYFDVEPTLQFARKMRVPAQTTLHLSVPVLIPKVDPKAGRQLNYRTLVFDVDGTREVLLKDESGAFEHDGALLLNFDRRISGFIDDPFNESDPTKIEAHELLIASRIAHKLDRKTGNVSAEGLPFDEQSLDALTNLMITGDRLLRDAAGAAAIRRWMFNGGRVWIVANNTDPRVWELLLGDEAHLAVIDQTELNTVRIDLANYALTKQQSPTAEHEVPVELLRVVATGFDVQARVDGWPAALSRQFGHGTLLVTTLGPRGWMTPRVNPPNGTEGGNVPPEFRSRFEVLPPMLAVLHDFFVGRADEIIAPDLLAPVASEFIGYGIPSLGLVFGVLSGFVVVIAGGGVWLWRRQQLERLGWLVPVAGVISGMLLIGIGRSNRHEITPTAASLQVFQSIPGSDDAVTHGLIATYHPEGTQSAFAGVHGGRLVPTMTGLSGTTRRMVWSDIGQWHWENVPQPAGQVSVPFSGATQSAKPLSVRATLDRNGLTGVMSNLPEGFSDPVLVSRAGRQGIDLKPSGEFTATMGKVFARDQYLDAELLNDEQTRRRQIMQQLLHHPARPDFPSQALVMGWTPPRDTGIGVGKEFREVGSALSVVPLQLERPAEGTEFVVPSPLLPYRAVFRPDGRPSSQVFDHRRNEWRESFAYSTVWLSFQVPPALQPLVLQRGQVAIQVSGPVGKLELLGVKDGKVATLATHVDPVGTVTLEVADFAGLKLEDDGNLRLGLNIGDQSRPELTQANDDGKHSSWRIDGLALTLWGKAQQ